MRNATTTGIRFTAGMASATQILHLNHDIETIPYIILTSPQPVNPLCKRMECQIKACLMLGIIPDHQDLRIAAGCINLCRSCTYTIRRSNKQAVQVCHGSTGMRIKSGICFCGLALGLWIFGWCRAVASTVPTGHRTPVTLLLCPKQELDTDNTRHKNCTNNHTS